MCALARVRSVALMAAGLVLLALGPAAAAPGDPPEPRSDLEALTEQRVATEAELDAVTEELETITVRITDARSDRHALVQDLAALQAAAARAEDVLADRAAHAYRHAGGSAMEIVLGAEGTGDALARVRMLDGLGRRERREVELAEAAQAAYSQRRERLASLAASLRADEDRLDELRGALQVAFDDVAAREADLAGRRDRQRTVSRSGQEGIYACPIAPPFHFRDTWGAPRSGGRSHKGVDIFGQMGAAVYAITDGTILRHSSSPLGGLGLYLAGDDGAQYYYSHLQEISPEHQPGRRVEAGERIAANGDSGNARGGSPHIHFEARPGGGAQVNPYPYAEAACF